MLSTKTPLTLTLKNTIVDLQKRTHQIISDLGQIAITKIEVNTALKEILQKYLKLQGLIQNFNIQLKNKYGLGQIDFLSNTYIRE